MENGFAMLVNHGITEHKLQAAYCKLDTFCSLPEEKKVIPGLEIGNVKMNCYKPPGSKIVGRLHEYKHTVTIKDVNEEILPEKEVVGFTRTVGSLIEDFQSLASVILQFIAIGCDVDADYFLEHHYNLMSDEDESYFQMTFFPPMDDCKPSNEMSSVETHELGTFSILSQDSEVGLEVQNGNKWISVGYLPGALLLRAGLCLQKWTDGGYKPAFYRMVVPDDNSVLSRSRHCAVLHVHPNSTSHIEPLSIIKHDFFSYYQSEPKRYCSLRRAYIYIRRRIHQFCR